MPRRETNAPAPAAASPIPIRALLRFVLIVAAVYGAAMLAYPPAGPWPGLGRLHAHVLAALGQGAYAGADPDRSVRFTVISPPPADRHDLQMTVGRRWRATTSSLLAGYGPAAMVVALVIATPVPWRRRLLALTAGQVLIHGLITLRMGAHLWFALNGPDAPGDSPGPAQGDSLTQHLGVVLYGPSVAYIAAVLVWLVVAVRSRDLARLAARAG